MGNSFRVLNGSDANLGDFVVKSVTDFNTFTATTTSALTSPAFILKHGLSSNEALSSSGGENVGVRGLSIFDHETLVADENIAPADSAFKVKLPNLASGTSVGLNKNATSILKRFPIGSYIQIDGEIMRIASSTLSGSSDEITVIRGALGTISPSSHPNGSKIKKVKPLSIELRRPSILRASGHTFEYLGYGPGNYSTALPQLQNRTLTEREEFLSQSQETSCGNVVYTGMNDKGDFYIGNTKISSSSGQQTTFDIPIPTITGEDPNRLSIVADEVIVKERLLVEGGTSKQILSQFDGPVTFNNDVRLSNATKKLDVVGNINIADTGQLNVNSTVNTTSATTGAAVVDGGIGIAKDIFIGGNVIGDGATNLSGFNNVTATNFIGNGAQLTNTGSTLSEPATGSHRLVTTSLTTGTMTTSGTDSVLNFNFATHTLSSTNFAGALTGNVTGNLTGTADKATDVVGAAGRVLFNSSTDDTTTSANLLFDGTRLSTNNVLAQNVKIAGAGANEIDTSSGNLILDAASNTVQVTTNLLVSGTTASTNKDSGALIVQGGVGIEGKLHVGDDIIAFNSSHINLKENITVIPNALDKINAISGNTFTWKSAQYLDTDRETTTSEADTGVIAQEVEALGLPGITTTRDDGTKAVRYERLVPVLIQAVKELSAKVTALEGS